MSSTTDTTAATERALMYGPNLTSAALLLLRLLLGVLLAAHGGLKFLQRGGLDFEADLLRKDGLRGGRAAAALSGITQLAAGAMLAAGMFVPLAGAAALGAMVVAVLAKARNGFWVVDDGAEFPLVFVVLAVAATMAGPGRWSLDHVLAVRPTSGEIFAALALGLTAGAATFQVLRQHRPDPRALRPAATAAPAADGPSQKEDKT